MGIKSALEKNRLLVTALEETEDIGQDLLEANQPGSISSDEGHDLSDALGVEMSAGGYESGLDWGLDGSRQIDIWCLHITGVREHSRRILR